MAASGLVGAYAVEVTSRVGSYFYKHRRGVRARPQEARAKARWRINQLYGDVLPSDLEPVSETISPGRWHVAFDREGYRYAAWTERTSMRGVVEVLVQRDRLHPDDVARVCTGPVAMPASYRADIPQAL